MSFRTHKTQTKPALPLRAHSLSLPNVCGQEESSAPFHVHVRTHTTHRQARAAHDTCPPRPRGTHSNYNMQRSNTVKYTPLNVCENAGLNRMYRHQNAAALAGAAACLTPKSGGRACSARGNRYPAEIWSARRRDARLARALSFPYPTRKEQSRMARSPGVPHRAPRSPRDCDLRSPAVSATRSMKILESPVSSRSCISSSTKPCRPGGQST